MLRILLRLTHTEIMGYADDMKTLPQKLKLKRPLTMLDVAEATGVSQSTVSRALRNDPQISEKVRTKVQAMARQLGYRPNPFVQAFTAQVRGYRKSPIHAAIALLGSHRIDHDISFLKRYRKGASEHAARLGYRVEPISLHDVNDSIPRLNGVLRARGIHGILILPVPADTNLETLAFDHLGSATIDYSLKCPNLHCAAPSYFQNMQMALRQLHALGYRRIGFCSYREEVDRIGYHWLGAFKAWQSLRPTRERVPVHMNPYGGHGTPHGLEAQHEADDAWTRDREVFQEWLARHRPDVVLSNDFYYFTWLEELGYRIPEDIGFATLSTDPDLPNISGIDQNHAAIAGSAIDLILGQLHRNDYGIPALRKTVLIDGEWVAGRTTR